MMYTSWLQPLQALMSSQAWTYSAEDGYDRYARTEYSKEHRDYQRVIAARMRNKARKGK